MSRLGNLSTIAGPMNGRASPSLTRRFGLLLALSTAGIVLFTITGGIIASQIGIHGVLYRQIADIQDLISDIEPPPMFLVEAMATAHQLARPTDTQPALSHLAELEKKYQLAMMAWRQRIPADQPETLHALADLHATANQFFTVTHQELLPAVEAGDQRNIAMVLDGPLSEAFIDHRFQVLHFMEFLIRSRAEAEGRASTIARIGAIVMAAMVAALLAAAVGLWRIRKNQQQQLQDSETRFRYLSAASFEGIAMSENGVLLDANPQFAAMVGHGSIDTLIGQSVSGLISPEKRSDFLVRIASQNEQDYETEMVRTDGQRIFVEARPRYYMLDGKRLRITALRDITQRKNDETELCRFRDHLQDLVTARTAELAKATATAERLANEADLARGSAVAALAEARMLEESLRLAKNAADTANRAKSEFLANMSHEIRTPLNAVLGYAQVMDRDPAFPAGHRQAVEVINRSGEHLLLLINDILEMSRIEAGAITCHYEDFDLCTMIDHLASLFHQRAKDKGLTLSIKRGEGLPKYIRTDQRKLRQILMNVLANALKFTHRGGVELLATTTPIQAQDDRSAIAENATPTNLLVISVVDSGSGIASEELSKLFQPFGQTDTARRRGEGTGLGLAICRGFLELLGGSIRVESTLGSGSTFIISLPFHLAATHHQCIRRIACLAPGQRAPRLLIAEDHADSRTMLDAWLRSVGCQTTSVADGAAAVAACTLDRPDLVWMDINMPVMDGIAATVAIRALPGPPPIIIALTAAAFSEDRARLLAHGCDDVVHKPFHEESLIQIMERHLGLTFHWRENHSGEEKTTHLNKPESLDHQTLRERLFQVDSSQRERLQAGIITGDQEAMVKLLAHWPDRQLAETLGELVAQFSFAQLLQLLEQPPGKS